MCPSRTTKSRLSLSLSFSNAPTVPSPRAVEYRSHVGTLETYNKTTQSLTTPTGVHPTNVGELYDVNKRFVYVHVYVVQPILAISLRSLDCITITLR